MPHLDSDPTESSSENGKQVETTEDISSKKRPLLSLLDLPASVLRGRTVKLSDSFRQRPRTRIYCKVWTDMVEPEPEPKPVSEVREMVNEMDICSPGREAVSEPKEGRRMEPPTPFPYCNNSRVFLVDDKNSCGRYPRRERGTTTIAFIFKDGIMFAADHSSKTSIPNMIQLHSHIIATISGGSEYLLKRLQKECYVYERRNRSRLPVAQAAKMLAFSVDPSMSTGGLLIGGWDEQDPVVYHVNREGKLEVVKEKKTYGTQLKWIRHATGSGADRAVGYLDYKVRSVDMTVDDAARLAKAAICYASYKAIQIGDFVSVYYLREHWV